MRMIYCLAIVLAVAVAPTGLRAQQGCIPNSPGCNVTIGDMFGQQMQTNKPKLQNRSGS